MTCWSCEGFDPRRECRTCKGETIVSFRRCPKRPEEVADVLRAHRWMKRGFLPVPGGYLDQSRTFLLAADWIDKITGFHERQALENKRDSS